MDSSKIRSIRYGCDYLKEALRGDASEGFHRAYEDIGLGSEIQGVVIKVILGDNGKENGNYREYSIGLTLRGLANCVSSWLRRLHSFQE